MKLNQMLAALVVGTLCAPAAMAKTQTGLRVKSGSIHAKSQKKTGMAKLAKVRKQRKPKKPVIQPAPAAQL